MVGVDVSDAERDEGARALGDIEKEPGNRKRS